MSGLIDEGTLNCSPCPQVETFRWYSNWCGYGKCEGLAKNTFQIQAGPTFYIPKNALFPSGHNPRKNAQDFLGKLSVSSSFRNLCIIVRDKKCNLTRHDLTRSPLEGQRFSNNTRCFDDVSVLACAGCGL
jgi:hypothetical protein